MVNITPLKSTKKVNVLNVPLSVPLVDWLMENLPVLKICVSMDTMKYKTIKEELHVLVVNLLNKISDMF